MNTYGETECVCIEPFDAKAGRRHSPRVNTAAAAATDSEAAAEAEAESDPAAETDNPWTELRICASETPNPKARIARFRGRPANPTNFRALRKYVEVFSVDSPT